MVACVAFIASVKVSPGNNIISGVLVPASLTEPAEASVAKSITWPCATVVPAVSYSITEVFVLMSV